MSEQPVFGLPPSVRAPFWWGARAIYEHSTTYTVVKKKGRAVRQEKKVFKISLLGDRQSLCGEATPKQKEKLEKFLNCKGIAAIERECNKLFVRPEDDVRVRIERGGYVVEASPRSSYGYLYLCAYESP